MRQHMKCSAQAHPDVRLQRETRAVTHSNRIIWSICENDVLAVAREKGIQMTEDQLSSTARYVEKGLSAVCNWFMLVEMALDEVVGSQQTVGRK
jgi:hypothetical protein